MNLYYKYFVRLTIKHKYIYKIFVLASEECCNMYMKHSIMPNKEYQTQILLVSGLAIYIIYIYLPKTKNLNH